MLAVIQTLIDTVAHTAELQFLVFTSVGLFGVTLTMELMVRRRMRERDRIFFAPPDFD